MTLYEQARAKAEEVVGEKVPTAAIYAAVSLTLDLVEQEARRRAEEASRSSLASAALSGHLTEGEYQREVSKSQAFNELADFCRSHRGTP